MAGVLLFGLAFLWAASGMRTEQARVEAETIAAMRKAILIGTNRVQKSPALVAEMILGEALREPRDENYYIRRFFDGMDRLVKMGALEKRSFNLGNTNTYAKVMNATRGKGVSGDVLWRMEGSTNQTVIVTARPSEMPKWQEFMRSFVTNSTMTQTNAVRARVLNRG